MSTYGGSAYGSTSTTEAEVAASSALTGESTLGASASGTQQVTAALAGEGALASTAEGTYHVSAALTGESTQAAGAEATYHTTASLTADGDIGGIVARLLYLSAPLGGEGMLGASASAVYHVTAALDGESIVRLYLDLIRLHATFTGSGSIRYVVPPRAALEATSTLEGGQDIIAGRTGGAVATVNAIPEGVGTKVLQGTTAVVEVRASGTGARVPPYIVHPNTREATNFVPRQEAALAALLPDTEREPPSGEGRQLVLLGAAPSTTEQEEDDSIFEVDHRA